LVATATSLDGRQKLTSDRSSTTTVSSANPANSTKVDHVDVETTGPTEIVKNVKQAEHKSARRRQSATEDLGRSQWSLERCRPAPSPRMQQPPHLLPGVGCSSCGGPTSRRRRNIAGSWAVGKRRRRGRSTGRSSKAGARRQVVLTPATALSRCGGFTSSRGVSLWVLVKLGARQ